MFLGSKIISNNYSGLPEGYTRWDLLIATGNKHHCNEVYMLLKTDLSSGLNT